MCIGRLRGREREREGNIIEHTADDFLMTMDYSPWVERETWPFLKVAISPNWRGHAHQNWYACMLHQHLLARIF